MTRPVPPAPPYAPTTDLVSRAWTRLAVPYVRVDDRLPKPDQELRTVGAIRLLTVGGGAELYVPMRRPVVTAECWVAPAEGSQEPPWNAAGRLAQWVLDATYKPELMGVLVDLTQFGAYLPARVHTVSAANEEPRRVENDPANYARYEVDLQFAWTAV